MKPGIGRLTAILADSGESIPSDIIGLINERIDPPEFLAADQVYVRAMYIVSDSINSFGGRFPSDEHEKLARMLVDSPVLVGHRKDQLPVARTFHAETTERDGRPWVKSYFYWPKDADGALKLKEKIDGGIVKECSISFTFNLPECSVCGKDIRLCPHEALQKIGAGSESAICHFNYREIERVLETSLVYRGAIPGTGITKPKEALSENSETVPSVDNSRKGLESLTQLNSEQQFLVVPNYEGISLTIGGGDKPAIVPKSDGPAIPAQLAERFDLSALKEYGESHNRPGRLVGYQGKKRCSVKSLEQYLSGKPSLVSRVVLYLYPDERGSLTIPKGKTATCETRLMPHRFAISEEIDIAGAEIMTRLGVEIWSLPLLSDKSECWLYQPKTEPPSKQAENLVRIDSDSKLLSVCLSSHESNQQLVVRDFSIPLLKQGRSFVADLILPESKQSQQRFTQNENIRLDKQSNGYRLEIRDKKQQLYGHFILRTIQLNGAKRHLFSLLAS